MTPPHGPVSPADVNGLRGRRLGELRPRDHGGSRDPGRAAVRGGVHQPAADPLVQEPARPRAGQTLILFTTPLVTGCSWWSQVRAAPSWRGSCSSLGPPS